MTDTKPAIAVTVEEDGAQDDREHILKQLQAYNRAQAGPNGHRPLFAALRDADAGGRLIGGLLGDTNRGWLHVDILWVEEAYRGQGLGGSLLAAAEAEAIRRGCTDAYLETFSFQAPEFYAKQGYRQFGQLDGFEPGGTQYFFTKLLAAPDSPSAL